jgi:hypothetical protein
MDNKIDVPLPEKTVLEFIGRNAIYMAKGPIQDVLMCEIPTNIARECRRAVVAIIPIL